MTRPVVLVTGASGFIGRRTLQPLAERGYEVHAAARRAPAASAPTFHEADLLDAAQGRRIVERVRPTHILHCAWEVTHGRFWTAPENLDWVAATLLLARAFAEGGGKRFVGLGTCVEYDWASGDPSPRRETDRIAPTTLYGHAKASTADILGAYLKGVGVSFAWARLFHLFGSGEPPKRLVASVAASLRRGERAATGAGDLLRDFIPAEVAGRALAAIVDSSVEGAVNVASGRAVSIAEIANTLGALAGRPELVAVGALPPAPDTPRAMLADIGRLRSEVGFDPAFDLRQALRDALDAAG